MATKKRRNKHEAEGLRLTDKHHPGMGIISTILAILSFTLFAVLCVLASGTGTVSIWNGFLGIVCFLVSIGGFVIAWLSLHQENIRPLFPTIGSIANGILVVGYLLLYVWGTTI